MWGIIENGGMAHDITNKSLNINQFEHKSDQEQLLQLDARLSDIRTPIQTRLNDIRIPIPTWCA